MPVSADTSVEVSHKGDVRTRTIDTAVDKVKSAAAICREPVGHIELRLTLEANPARERPAIAETTLDVDGRAVRAHVAADTLDEAVDALVDRLRRRLKRHEERRHRQPDRHRTGVSGPGEWRHGDLRAASPEYMEVPFDEREVRRHKTFALTPISVDEAAFDLEQLGHEFYLFVDLISGCDSLVRGTAEGGIELQCVDGAPDPSRPDLAAVRVNETAPPALGLVEAKEHLEASGDQYLFYNSTDTGRGQVLYRRYDGHYGLVTPA